MTQYDKIVQIILQQGQQRGDNKYAWYRWHTGR
jgi:hypothetical protein